MDDVSTEKLLDELRSIFARWGIPSQIVTDNGPQFTSQKFEQFVRANNCKHTRTSPYHPATNGLAERFVQSLKQALRASHKEVKSLHHRIACFLIHNRNARHSTVADEEGSEEYSTSDETRCAGKCIQKSDSTSEDTGSTSREGLCGGGPSDGQETTDLNTQGGNLQWYMPGKDPSPTKLHFLEPRGVPWRRHSDQMVHGPEGVALDPPRTGKPDE